MYSTTLSGWPSKAMPLRLQRGPPDSGVDLDRECAEKLPNSIISVSEAQVPCSLFLRAGVGGALVRLLGHARTAVATRSFFYCFGHFLKPIVLNILYFRPASSEMASSIMAIARAIIKHIKYRRSHTDILIRKGSIRYLAGIVNKQSISPFTELISTINVNALNYLNISSLNSVSPLNSFISSGNDSDLITISRNFIDSIVTTLDLSSIEASPISNLNNSLSYFDTPHRSKAVIDTRPFYSKKAY